MYADRECGTKEERRMDVKKGTDRKKGITKISFRRAEMYALSDFLIMVFVMVSEAVT